MSKTSKYHHQIYLSHQRSRTSRYSVYYHNEKRKTASFILIMLEMHISVSHILVLGTKWLEMSAGIKLTNADNATVSHQKYPAVSHLQMLKVRSVVAGFHHLQLPKMTVRLQICNVDAFFVEITIRHKAYVTYKHESVLMVCRNNNWETLDDQNNESIIKIVEMSRFIQLIISALYRPIFLAHLWPNVKAEPQSWACKYLGHLLNVMYWHFGCFHFSDFSNDSMMRRWPELWPKAVINRMNPYILWTVVNNVSIYECMSSWPWGVSV